VQAAYNSGRAGGPTTCFKDTRVAVLNTIKSWISDPNTSVPPVFWLNGMAGIGKSTIAKTVAEYAYDRGILGGSFLFSRDDQQLRDPSLVFPTLAFQLAQSADVFRSLIGKALQKDGDYGHRARLIQLEELIIRPLVQSGLSGSKHVVLLVIDALDECAPEAEAADILRLILAHISRIPFIFRVFLTSRPESHITKVFNEKYNHKKYILHDIEEKIVRDDIHLFIESNLRDLPGRLDVKIKGEWPPMADMEILVDKCGKLFVYAATSLRFIGNDRVRNPVKQLEVLLGARVAVNAKPFAQLDQLYLQVLRSALPDDSEEDLILRFHWVVGSIVLLRDPLSVDSLSRFIKYDAEDVSDALYHLHSIILPPSSFEEAPRIYHPSFPDFITNSSRCSEPTFLVDVPKHEKRLVLRCLDVMLSTLKRDILEIGNYSYQLNTEIDSLMKVINEHVPAEVQYSCHHWASHLSKVTVGDEEVINVLAQFAFQKLLNWIEVMSLLNLSGLAVSSMRDAHKWAVSQCLCLRAQCTNYLQRLSQTAIMGLFRYCMMDTDLFYPTSKLLPIVRGMYIAQLCLSHPRIAFCSRHTRKRLMMLFVSCAV
jgi:NACHT domain